MKTLSCPHFCRFDDDPIKNEDAFVSTTFLHYMCMGKFFNTQGQVTQKLMVGSGKNSKLSGI